MLFQSSREEGYFNASRLSEMKKVQQVGGNLNCVYGGAAGGAAVMSALV